MGQFACEPLFVKLRLCYRALLCSGMTSENERLPRRGLLYLGATSRIEL